MKKFSIYQVNDEAENARYIKFSGLDFVRKHFTLTLDIYSKVYEGEMGDDEDLDDLFCKFNHGTLPYKGHSLSVSDLVEVDGKFYYCDDYYWQEVEFEAAA